MVVLVYRDTDGPFRVSGEPQAGGVGRMAAPGEAGLAKKKGARATYARGRRVLQIGVPDLQGDHHGMSDTVPSSTPL